MKKNIWLTLLYLQTVALYAQPSTEMWTINDESQLSINGTSNVNVFECSYDQNFDKSRISLVDSSGVILFRQNLILFEVKSFNCNNTRITSDLRKTLKEPSYPLLKMNLVKLYQTEKECTLELLLTIAGEKKSKHIHLKSCNISENKINLEGNYKMNLSDFGLVPPTALWGMVKVNDEITIDFSFYLENK
ncbi:MAG: YceI family protein [Cyclobacteriaceae bacterium]